MVYLLTFLLGHEKPSHPGVFIHQQAVDADTQPGPGARPQQGLVSDIDAVHLMQVGLDELPLREQVAETDR
jgi:hypothetical protein